MKPSLNNKWGREIGNRIRSYFNLPPAMEHDSGLLNIIVGESEHLLVLEPASVEDVALMSLFKKVDTFSLARHLNAMLQEVHVSKNLPTPVHVALQLPASVILAVRIRRQASNDVPRFLDMLFTIYKNVEKYT